MRVEINLFDYIDSLSEEVKPLTEEELIKATEFLLEHGEYPTWVLVTEDGKLLKLFDPTAPLKIPRAAEVTEATRLTGEARKKLRRFRLLNSREPSLQELLKILK